MSRLVHRQIEVKLNGETPATFVDGEVTHEIATIRDWWLEAGDWWNHEKSRTIYQVATSEGYMFDIEHTGEGWFIYRIWD